MKPTMQVTVTLAPDLDAWLDTTRDGPPILVLETGCIEVCLVLRSDQVTADDVSTARRLAELLITFAAGVAARSGSPS